MASSSHHDDLNKWLAQGGEARADGSGRGSSNDDPKVVKASNENNGTQKVYVKGGEKEQAVEFEVYNQGMLLCNKWEQTGAFPYGDNCQFAHGIAELRPGLRHPRCKTKVCHMVLTNVPCPYGHPCYYLSPRRAINSNFLQPMSYRLDGFRALHRLVIQCKRVSRMDEDKNVWIDVLLQLVINCFNRRSRSEILT